MALKQNGGAHLSSDIDFIATPKAPADVLSTGKNPGVPLTNASRRTDFLPLSKTLRSPPTAPDTNNGPTSSSASLSTAFLNGYHGNSVVVSGWRFFSPSSPLSLY
ncbi:hypothetical protein LB503_007177 [Fusarium chuoi]|nr:hypothetical protein LB503_007177 [Fusarium chuoi]